MAKKSNVHPDYYKTAGREPVGQGTLHEDHRQEFSAAAKTESTERSHRTSSAVLSNRRRTANGPAQTRKRITMSDPRRAQNEANPPNRFLVVQPRRALFTASKSRLTREVA